jgi:hypothetical protein
MKNNDPFNIWNDPMMEDDPFMPHNNPMRKDDLFEPWNDPLSSNDDLSDRDKKVYGLRVKDYNLDDEDKLVIF